MAAAPFVKRLSVDEAAKSPLAPATEGLASYVGVASDGAKSSSEAAAQLTAAEAKLRSGEAQESADSAAKAQRLFEDLGDSAGAADAAVLAVHALRLRDELLGARPREAAEKAAAEAKRFAAQGDRRGEACLNLARADLRGLEAPTAGVRGEGAKEANAALQVFRDLGDKRMEASALLVLMGCGYLRGKSEETKAHATNALALFKEIGDRAGQAKALHGTALALALDDDYDGAVKQLQAAYELFKELGDKRGMAFERQVAAQLLLEAEAPQKALHAAKDALALVRELGTASGRLLAVALFLVCQALLDGGKEKQALEMATRSRGELLQGSDDQVGVASLVEVVVYVHYRCDQLEEAIASAQEALKMAGEAGSTKLQLSLLHALSLAQLAKQSHQDAVAAMRDALLIAQGAGDDEEEAAAQRMIAYIYSQKPDLQVDQGSLTEAKTAADAARSICKAKSLKRGEAASALLLAYLATVSAQGQESLDLLREAQDLYHEAEDLEGENYALRMLAEAHLSREEQDAALEAGAACVQLWKAAGRKRWQADALHLVATIRLQRSQVQEARQDLTEALQLSRSAGAKTLEAASLLLLTRVYVQDMAQESLPEGTHDPLPQSFVDVRNKAQKAVKDALLLAGQSANRSVRAAALFWRSEVMAWNFNAGDALRSAEEAAKTFDKAKDVRGQANSLVLVAELQFLVGNKAAAKEAAEAILQLARESPAADLGAAMQTAQGVLSRMQVRAETVAAPSPLGLEAGAAPAAPKPGLNRGEVELKVNERVQNLITEDSFDADTPLMDAGVDSLSSVTLVSELSSDFKLALAPSVVFDFPTARQLIDHIIEESGM